MLLMLQELFNAVDIYKNVLVRLPDEKTRVVNTWL
jgi:hypothetical protein